MSNDSGSEPTSESPEGSEKRLWYVLKVQSNREKSIRDALLRGIKRDGLEEYFGEIIIPTEKVVETKGGKKRVFERKLYPGYLMIQVELNDDSWYLVRSTNGVGDFTGAAGKPIPMQEETPVKIKLDFQVGDVVKVKDATFEGFEGTIDAVDEASGKVTVLIEIFSRPTPTELEYWQIEKV